MCVCVPACTVCPAGSEPVLGYEYKWWNVLPSNMKTSCFNVGNSKCDNMNGEHNDNCVTEAGRECLVYYDGFIIELDTESEDGAESLAWHTRDNAIEYKTIYIQYAAICNLE